MGFSEKDHELREQARQLRDEAKRLRQEAAEVEQQCNAAKARATSTLRELSEYLEDD